MRATMSHEARPSTVPYLTLKSISKNFGVTQALKEMDLEIRPGEVLGLVGPNGAGKSTLIKVITGVHLLSNLTVYENFMIHLMDHTPFAKPGWRKRAGELTQQYLDNVFPDHGIDVNTAVSELFLAQRQMVEIAKAVSFEGLKILILDEPTSSLGGGRILQLHNAIRSLSKQGIAVIYISHKLDEIEKVCDRVVVMKSGTTAWEGRRAETSMHDLVEILGGKVTTLHKVAQENRDLPVALTIKGLTAGKLKNINMHVRKGELIGISGLEGAGQNELIQEIFKASRKRHFLHRNSRIDLRTNVSYVGGDRYNEGIFGLWNIADNTVISNLGKVTKAGLIRKNRYISLAMYWYDKLKFTARGISDDITSLSGGNQQKTWLARGLAADSDLILLNDPTSGVDVETKQEIYKLLDEAKQQGKAIILHSTEDLEMEQCDRVYVMHDGRIVEELVGEHVTVQNIIKRSFAEKSKGASLHKEVDFKGRPGSVIRKLTGNRAFLAFVTLISIFFINSILNSRILSYMGIQFLYSSAVPLVFIALGQMFMVIPGGIDLGNGQSVGLMNVIVAFIVAHTPGPGIAYTLLFVLAYGGLAAIIYWTKIPAIVITLGAAFVWLGFALLVAPIPGGRAPAWLNAFYNYHFPVIPMPIVISIFAALLSYWIVRKSKYGMVINGIGNNPQAVSRAGWSQLTAMVVAYSLSGFMIVIGSFMLTAISNSGDSNSAGAYCMSSIATIILGGCSFFGGVSSPVGVVAAALGISSISFLLTFLGIDSNLQSAVTGLILIIALALKMISSKMVVQQ
jgi:ribose transport system ATP-binding protein